MEAGSYIILLHMEFPHVPSTVFENEFLHGGWGQLTSPIWLTSSMAIWVIRWYVNPAEHILIAPHRGETNRFLKRWSRGRGMGREGRSTPGKGAGLGTGSPRGGCRALRGPTRLTCSRGRGRGPSAAADGARRLRPCSLAAGRGLRGRRARGHGFEPAPGRGWAAADKTLPVIASLNARRFL